MKAIRVHEWGEPDVLQYETVPDLPAPGKGEVLVSVRAVGVNPVDTYIRTGTYANSPSLPYTPGTDAAGIVEAIGPDVENVAVGDRVYTAGTITGAYAEQTLVRAATVHRLPDKVSFEQGAGVFVPYATAYRALVQKARGVAGEGVLVHGASGGVGLAAVQIARWLGFNVWGTASTVEGRDLITAQGAQHVLNHSAPDYLAEGKTQTPNGAGWDVILEMLANVNLGKDLPYLTIGGRVVVIGSRGPVEINPRDAMGREAVILGMSLWNMSPKDDAAIVAALHAGLSSGALSPVVGKTFPLAEAAQAHEAIINSVKGAQGKIVLIP